MKITRRQLKRVIKESIEYDNFIHKDMDFEALNTQINLLLNATANPSTWKQVDHAGTEIFIFKESEFEFDDEDPWYVPWHNLKDAFENAGIPNYYDMGVWERSQYKGVSYSTEIKKSRIEGGTRIPQINIFILWGR
tara:strand:+ start:115 stop:522 length:408 start_codon:yes stop_codon:yes gene_type:complete